MVRHFTGHTSTHELHTIQRRRSITHVFSSLLIHNASEGHFFMHMPHDMHFETSIITCPRDRPVLFAGTWGYGRVAGFPRTVLIAIFAISKNAILYHLSMHPIQGSIDSTITGTSASSHPCIILTSDGMFVSVGVRILDLAICFVPFPLT